MTRDGLDRPHGRYPDQVLGEYPRNDSVEILMSVSVHGWHGMPMTTTGGIGRELVEARWGAEAIVTASVVAAALPMGFLHLTSAGSVDPVADVISDYVFQPGGYALLGLAAISLAVGCIVLAVGVHRAALPHACGPAALFGTAAVALVLVAVFPTHAPGTTPGMVSTVHRAAGGWVFAVLPLAAWMVARRARSAPGWISAAPALSWAAGVAGVVSVFFILNHVPIVVAGSSVFPLMGTTQRVLCAAVMVMMVMTARASRLALDRSDAPAVLPARTPLRGAA